jgi:GT2 family glycosyltransferase
MGEGRFVLFLNDDIYPIHSDWLSDLIEIATETSGIVGSTLLYPDGKVQHAGMFYKPDLSFHHLSRYMEGRKLDYFEFGEKFKPVSVITGASMLVDRVFFEKIGGFDENLGHYLQDVDLCIKASLSGVSIYQAGRPLGMHFESLTIRDDLQNENIQRLRENEYRYFLRKWSSRIVGHDPWAQNYLPEMLTDNVR